MDVLKDWAVSQNISEFFWKYTMIMSLLLKLMKNRLSKYILEMRFNLDDEKK